MKRKKTKAWAIIEPDGSCRLASNRIGYTQRDAIDNFVNSYVHSWEHYESLGYRCVRVTIEEEE